LTAARSATSTSLRLACRRSRAASRFGQERGDCPHTVRHPPSSRVGSTVDGVRIPSPTLGGPSGAGHPWPAPEGPKIFKAAPGDRDVAWRSNTHRPPMTAWTDSHQGAPPRRGTPAASLPAGSARDSMTVKGDKMPDDISGTSLAGYGAETYARYHYTCVYCGFDGRGFDAWMQLTVDHIKPTSAGGKDDPDNLVPACHACNSITSRMPFTDTASREEILAQKRERVRQRRVLFHDYWLKTVAPHFLDRPLPSA